MPSHANAIFPPSMQQVLSSIGSFGASGDGDHLAVLFAHTAPIFLQNLSGAHQELDELASVQPDLVRRLMIKLREGLEPFPQMQETNTALDEMLQTESTTGFGVVVEGFLRTFTQLPFDQQRDIASTAIADEILGSMIELCSKAERKAAKQAWKETQKAQKETIKAGKNAWKNGHANKEVNTTDCTDHTEECRFPVHLGDGCRLQIASSRNDDLEQVAINFATENCIAQDEVPDITASTQCASAAANAPTLSALEQSEMKEKAPSSTDATPSAPTYTGPDDEQVLQTLEEMGFPNREFNLALLAAHNGNIELVLEKLI